MLISFTVHSKISKRGKKKSSVSRILHQFSIPAFHPSSLLHKAHGVASHHGISGYLPNTRCFKAARNLPIDILPRAIHLSSLLSACHRHLPPCADVIIPLSSCRSLQLLESLVQPPTIALTLTFDLSYDGRAFRKKKDRSTKETSQHLMTHLNFISENNNDVCN